MVKLEVGTGESKGWRASELSIPGKKTKDPVSKVEGKDWHLRSSDLTGVPRHKHTMLTQPYTRIRVSKYLTVCVR